MGPSFDIRPPVGSPEAFAACRNALAVLGDPDSSLRALTWAYKTLKIDVAPDYSDETTEKDTLVFSTPVRHPSSRNPEAGV